jgi:hypothetical protein
MQERADDWPDSDPRWVAVDAMNERARVIEWIIAIYEECAARGRTFGGVG